MTESGHVVSVKIIDDDADSSETRELMNWLLDDENVHNNPNIMPKYRDAPPGTMPGLDLVDFVLSNAINLGALVMSVAAFLRSRGSSPKASATIDKSVVIEISAEHAQSHEEIDKIVADVRGRLES